MPLFYHLDRIGPLREGQIVKLMNVEINDNLELGKSLSSHGVHYLINRGLAQCECDRNHIIYDQSFITELFYEIIRQKNFKEKQSRFKSFFAFYRVEDIFKSFEEVEGNILEVEFEEFYRYDMKLLNLKSGKAKEISLLASNYWNGDVSDDPLYEYLLVPPIKIIKKVKI